MCPSGSGSTQALFRGPWWAVGPEHLPASVVGQGQLPPGPLRASLPQLCLGPWAAWWLLEQHGFVPTPSPRLLHYFRGRHHLEEIMYNENTRRSQLLMLFDKFRSVLVVTTHEDPVIAVFQALLTGA